MRVTVKGVMPDKTKIQMEDWSQDFPSIHSENDVVAAYPIAKQPATTLAFEGVFGFRKYEYPQQYRTFRFALQFPTAADAETAYNNLVSGEVSLLDYEKFAQNKEHVKCL